MILGRRWEVILRSFDRKDLGLIYVQWWTLWKRIPWKSKTKQRMVFWMIHVKDSLLPMGKVWSLDFLRIWNPKSWRFGKMMFLFISGWFPPKKPSVFFLSVEFALSTFWDTKTLEGVVHSWFGLIIFHILDSVWRLGVGKWKTVWYDLGCPPSQDAIVANEGLGWDPRS